MGIIKKHLKKIMLGASLVSIAFVLMNFFFIVDMSPNSGIQITHGVNSPIIVPSGNIIIDYGNEVDISIRKLGEANIAFDSPSTMQKNEVENISLILSAKGTIEQLLKEIAAKEKESATIKYSKRMKAELIGENKRAFEITKITPSLQAVGTMRPTRWKWGVTPLESGVQYLHLTLTAFITVDGNETELSVKTFDREIQVEVSAMAEVQDFFTENWKWLLGSLIFPLIAWYWKSKQSNEGSHSG